MRMRTAFLVISLALISTVVFAEVTTMAVRNPDQTVTKIFYNKKGKEVAKQTQDREGNVTKTTGKIPDGIVKEYLDSGALFYEWNYKNGKLEGITKEYFLSGELLEDILYKNDKREGISKKYHKSGKLLAERNFKEATLDGMTRMYYESGKIFGELIYKNNQLDGETRIYYENGKLKFVESYKNGQKATMKAYDPEGKVTVEHDYTAEKSAKTTPLPPQPKDIKKTGKTGKK